MHRLRRIARVGGKQKTSATNELRASVNVVSAAASERSAPVDDQLRVFLMCDRLRAPRFFFPNFAHCLFLNASRHLCSACARRFQQSAAHFNA